MYHYSFIYVLFCFQIFVWKHYNFCIFVMVLFSRHGCYAENSYITKKCGRCSWNCGCDDITNTSKSLILRPQFQLQSATENHDCFLCIFFLSSSLVARNSPFIRWISEVSGLQTRTPAYIMHCPYQIVSYSNLRNLCCYLLDSGVFYCGSPTLTKSLKSLCQEFSLNTSTRFHFHKENF